MLHELRIRNFAIINDLTLRFSPGLNILTGETGAGKSIIIDAVSLLLGDRAATEWVRAGSSVAEIEAVFRLHPDGEVTTALHEMLDEQGLDDPDNPGWLSLGREVRLGGRNVCRVNGRAVSLQILANITAQLVDVHGQGEHLSLLRPSSHLRLLDRFGGLFDLRAAVGQQVEQLRTVRNELQRLRRDARTLAQRIDLLSFQCEEITAAQLQVGEDEHLEGERRRLSNAESLLQLAQSAQLILTEGDGEMPAAMDQVSEAVGRMEKLARIDPSMSQAALDGQGVLEQMADLARSLQDYAELLEYNPERLQEVEERLELIANLKRKYGDTIAQVLAFQEQARAELETLQDWDIKTVQLEEQEEALLHTIGRLSADLSARRRVAGDGLARQVETELSDLHMDRARFDVAIHQTEQADGAYWDDGRRVVFDATGADQIEFLISANPGEPLKAMAKVASGGETARLMLALKGVLANADAVPTLIFDEIDQGIGGRVGSVVGRKLWHLTGQQSSSNADHARHQVLCITHLPQLAAFGDLHLAVYKEVTVENGDERTSARVHAVEGSSRVEELMQMLGATTDAGRRSVEEMMADVTQIKRGPISAVAA